MWTHLSKAEYKQLCSRLSAEAIRDAHLKRNKFFEYKTHKIAQRLRDLGGQSRLLRIKERPVRVWEIPAFDSAEVELTAPSFGNGTGEAPF